MTVGKGCYNKSKQKGIAKKRELQERQGSLLAVLPNKCDSVTFSVWGLLPFV